MQDDNKLNKQIRATLDVSVDNLDPDISRRLQQARHAVLETTAKPRMPFWQPAGAFALASILLLSVLVWPDRQNMPEPAALADLELITADDSLQLYEDLDFYQWLLESDTHAG
ncbi:hypothetical protein MNBD_GAMMA25-1588 [hydrothermal vent metagenome]|uniref:DUF3619 family protein n=1 Tax=hydrothermal vent metagenome TaxID=652676 RepID=A0A3B1BGV4_9ZZZZ